MPKRSSQENMEYYIAKIRKIERRLKRRHKHWRRQREESSSEDEYSDVSCISDNNMSNESHNESETKKVSSPQRDPPEDLPTEDPLVVEEPSPSTVPVDNTAMVPTTDPDVLNALGDLMPNKPKFGPPINNDVARIWSTILKEGLQKEVKNNLLENVIPENCTLLKAPQLNQELSSSITSNIINRDKKIEAEQNQLGVGIAIMGSALSTLILNEKVDRLKLISTLSDAGRVLTDLHQAQTKARKNLLLPVLDKTFVDTIKDIQRDDYLYGTNLVEKIKVLKSCQRNGSSIKKSTTVNTNSNNRQGNANGPPRHNQQRTQPRYGHKKTHYSSSTQARKNQYQNFTRKTKQTKPPART